MPFALDSFSRTRPFLYHLTFRHNLEHIRSRKQLESATRLLGMAARDSERRTQRLEKRGVTVDGAQVFLRDQYPLREANIEFTGGWTFEKLLEELNSRVFFWPGSKYEPICYGVRHFEAYASENPVMLRVAFESLVACNPERTPFFTKYNSGSPRYSGGRPSPRGPDTFLPADQCSYPPSRVAEVTFLDTIVLPDETAVSHHIRGPWTPLFGTA